MVGKATDLVAPLLGKPKNKTLKFVKGREHLLDDIEEELLLDPRKKTLWMHSASLGEFNIGKPVLRKLKEEYNFVLTFFSPSGYETVKKGNEFGLNVFYLPWDTPENASRFLDIVKPDAMIFMVAEFWHNYIREAKARNIPSFHLSYFYPQSPAGTILKSPRPEVIEDMKSFTSMMPVDGFTGHYLAGHGAFVPVYGDLLYENAANVAATPYRNEIVERFKGESGLIVAGSIYPGKDIEMVKVMSERYPEKKILLVPHNTDESTLREIKKAFGAGTKMYSECDPSTDFRDVKNIVIDYVGDLSKLYRYGDIAYVGGGFNHGVHSVVEPMAYGLLTVFGPNYKRQPIAYTMLNRHVGISAKSKKELRKELQYHYASDPESTAKTCALIVNNNLGMTDKAVRIIRKFSR